MALRGSHGRDIENSSSVTTITGSTIYTKDYALNITFDGNAGTGAIGPVTIPSLLVKNGWFIEDLLVDVVTTLADDSGNISYLTLGFTGTSNVGLNTTTGHINSLNTDVNSKIQLSNFILSTSDTNILTLDVNNANITSGQIKILIRITNYDLAISGDGIVSGGGGSTYTASNGITLSSSDFILGGNLTVHTYIDAQNFDFQVYNINTAYLTADIGTKTAGVYASVTGTIPVATFSAANSTTVKNMFSLTPTSASLQTGTGAYTFTQLTVARYIPISVNGNFANATGDITISTGGSASKFGVTGEDNLAAEDRTFSLSNTNFFKFKEANLFSVSSGDLTYTTQISTFDINKVSVNISTNDNNATLYSSVSTSSVNVILRHYNGPNGGNVGIDDGGPYLQKSHVVGPTNIFSKLTVPDTGVTNLIEVSRVIPVSVNGIPADATGDIKTVINILYANLITAITNSTLVPGSYYKITDYQTVHIISGTTDTNTGATNPIQILAVASNKLSPFGYCLGYPGDIVYYEPINNTTLIPGCTKGYIYRRIDSKWKIDLGFDFKEVKFRRYAATNANVYSIGTTYNNGDFVNNGSKIYGSNKPNNVGISQSTENYWTDTGINIGDYYGSVYYGTSVAIGDSSWTFTADPATFLDFKMFNSTDYAAGNYYNIIYDYGLKRQVNDILFNYDNVCYSGVKLYDITISEGSYMRGNTFGGGLHTVQIYNLSLRNDSYISQSVFMDGAFMFGLDMSDSNLRAVILTNYGSIFDSGFNNSSIFNLVNNSSDMENNTFYSSGFGTSNLSSGSVTDNAFEFSTLQNLDGGRQVITKNKFSNCFIQGILGLGDSSKYLQTNEFKDVNITNPFLSSSINAYSDFPCTIYKRPDGTYKLSFMNNSDTLTVTNVNA